MYVGQHPPKDEQLAERINDVGRFASAAHIPAITPPRDLPYSAASRFPKPDIAGSAGKADNSLNQNQSSRINLRRQIAFPSII